MPKPGLQSKNVNQIIAPGDSAYAINSFVMFSSTLYN